MWPEGVSLEPGWPPHGFGGVSAGTPLDARQAHQPSHSSRHTCVEAKPLQCSGPLALHWGQNRQTREALHEAVSVLAGTAGFEIFTEPPGNLCTGHLEPGGQRTTGTQVLPLLSSSLINLVYQAKNIGYKQKLALEVQPHVTLHLHHTLTAQLSPLTGDQQVSAGPFKEATSSHLFVSRKCFSCIPKQSVTVVQKHGRHTQTTWDVLRFGYI